MLAAEIPSGDVNKAGVQALITPTAKGRNKSTSDSGGLTCIVQGCTVERKRGLCKRHFLEMNEVRKDENDAADQGLGSGGVQRDD